MTAGRHPALVDIGIPVSTRRDFVVKAVESVFAQSFSDWRLVVSQDGPRDEAIAATLMPYLDDPRVDYVSTSKRVGAPANKTQLIARGSGPFVALLDDDDTWKPHFLEAQVDFLQVNDAAAFVFTANDVIDGTGRVIGRSRPPLPTGVYEPRVFMPLLVRHNVVATPTVLVRRAAYERVGSTFDARLPTMYDYDMWLRIAAQSPVGYRESWDASYRQHRSQQTVAERSKRAEHALLLVEKIEEILAENPALEIPSSVVREKRARALLSHALDEFEAGRSRTGRSAVIAAVRESRSVIGDPKFPIALASALAGPVARHTLRRIRVFNLRRGIVGGRLDSGARVRLRAQAVWQRARLGGPARHVDRP